MNGSLRLFPRRRHGGSMVLALACFLFLAVAPQVAGQTVWGHALSLDGSNDYVRVADFGQAMPTNEITVEFWLKVDAVKQQAAFSLQPDDPANRFQALVPWTGGPHGTLYWDYGDTTGQGRQTNQLAQAVVGRWTHFAFTTYSNPGVAYYSIIYVNGEQVDAKVYHGTFTRGDYDLLIGGFIGTIEVFTGGQMDDFRIWDGYRSEAEIQSTMNAPLTGTEPGLVAYWPFDEGTGTTAADASGNGHSGILTNGTAWVLSMVPGGGPLATTLPATDFLAPEATLNGTVNPNGTNDTWVWFEWGTNTAYGSATSITNIGTGSNAVPITAQLGGLEINTEYHFRIAASNHAGVAVGENLKFTPPLFTDIGASLPGVWLSCARWGDYDGDGDLDILLSGEPSGGGQITRIYRNDGGVFTDIEAGLPGVRTSFSYLFQGDRNVAWGDCDNDGDLDILLTGDGLARVYRNDGGVFTNLQAGLPGVTESSAAWGDCDNDGRLDILLSGLGKSAIYRNAGDGLYTEMTNAPVAQVEASSVAWADYDNDGWQDILLAGLVTGADPVTLTYRNLGAGAGFQVQLEYYRICNGSVAWGDYDANGQLDYLVAGRKDGNTGPAWSYLMRLLPDFDIFAEEAGVNFLGVEESSVAWGDYDNDGDLDILLAGLPTGGAAVTELHRNRGGGSFDTTPTGLPGVRSGSVAWGDYDNDGDLDVLLTSWPGLSRIYRNNTLATNAPPSAPGGLSAAVTNDGVRLEWTAASDAQTSVSNLTYNVRVGTSPGGCDIVSPQAHPATGWRQLPAMGNANLRTFSIVTNLPSGLYYWSVQAVDNAFAGGPFAEEQLFHVGDPSLSIETPTNSIVVSWPALVEGWSLHAKTNLVDGAWTEIPPPYATNDTHYLHIEPPSNSSKFFQLQKP